MKITGLIMKLLIIACIVSMLLCSINAQETSSLVSTTGTILSQTAQSSIVSTSLSSSDIFTGTGTKGPFILSWRQIEQFSERVFIDGIVVQRGLGYDVDYTSGILAFKEPVNPKSTIRIDYEYNPTRAVKNNSQLEMPLQLNLIKSGDTDLRLVGLYKQGDPKSTNSNLAVYGLSGNTKAGVADISSMFLFTPDRPGAESDKESSFSDRAALKFGGATKSDKFQLNTSYLRVGEGFEGAKEYKLQRGLEAMDLSATFTPIKMLSLSSSYNRSEDLTELKKGESSATASYKLELTPEGAPRFIASRTEVDKGKPDAENESTITDKLRLEHSFNSRMSASAMYENVVSEEGDYASKTTTNQISLNAKPSDALAISSKLMQEESSEDGKLTNMGINVVAAPSKTINLKAALTRSDSEKTGEENSGTLNLVMNPIAKTTLNLDWAQRDSEINGSEEVGGIRVQTSLLKAVKFSGALTQKDASDIRRLSKEARLEINPFDNTTLGGAYQEIESDGDIIARVTEISAKTKPVSYLAFSGAYKLREQLDQEDLDSVNLALTVDTGTLVKLTGAYTENPEDINGEVQRLNSQSVGIKTDFGRIKLKGAYTLKNEYLAGTRSTAMEYGLDYMTSAYSRLTTSYSVDESDDGSNYQTSMYALGFTHKVGSRLDLYLGGKLTTYERDQVMLKGLSDYKAEAKLGLKF